MTPEGELKTTVLSARSSQGTSRLSSYDSVVEVIYGDKKVWKSSPSKRRGSLLQWGETFTINTCKDVPGQLQLRVKSAGIVSHEAVSPEGSNLLKELGSKVHASVDLTVAFVSGDAYPAVELLTKDGKVRGEVYLQLNFVSAFELMHGKTTDQMPAASTSKTPPPLASSAASKVIDRPATVFQPLGSGVALYHTPPTPSDHGVTERKRAIKPASRKSIAHSICCPVVASPAESSSQPSMESQIQLQIDNDADLARQLSGSTAGPAEQVQIRVDEIVARKLFSESDSSGQAPAQAPGSQKLPHSSLVVPDSSTSADEGMPSNSNRLTEAANANGCGKMQGGQPAIRKDLRPAKKFQPLSTSQVGRSSLRSFFLGRRNSKSSSPLARSSNTDSTPTQQHLASKGPCSQRTSTDSAGSNIADRETSSQTIDTHFLKQLSSSDKLQRSVQLPAGAESVKQGSSTISGGGNQGLLTDIQDISAVRRASADAVPAPQAQRADDRSAPVSSCPAARRLSFSAADLAQVAEACKELGGLIDGTCKSQLERDILQATSMRGLPSAPPLPEDFWSIGACWA